MTIILDIQDANVKSDQPKQSPYQAPTTEQDISIGRGCERVAEWILGGWIVAERVPGVGMAASIKGSK